MFNDRHIGRILILLILGMFAVVAGVMRTTTMTLVTQQEQLQGQLSLVYQQQVRQRQVINSVTDQLNDELAGIRTETSDQIAAAQERVTVARRELESAIEDQREVSLTEVVNEWRSRIAFVQCQFNFLGARIVQRGAATFFGQSGVPVLLTNRHVVEGFSGEFEQCYYRFPQDTDNIQFPEEAITFGVGETVSQPDYATIELTEPNAFVRDLMSTDTNHVCTEEPQIGDEVIVLGFPTIGSSRDVTATEGIIAAIEGDYYVTSAKVDSGNSGGAAIHVENKCYLGIPTSTALGQAESLARILRADILEF